LTLLNRVEDITQQKWSLIGMGQANAEERANAFLFGVTPIIVILKIIDIRPKYFIRFDKYL